MFENIMKFFRKLAKKQDASSSSKDTAKERLHLVLMQDRANVSADFLDLMRQEIIDVIKKYIEVDESAIDVRLTNKENADGTNGAPALYANIPIINIKDEVRKQEHKVEKQNKKEAPKKEDKKESKEVEPKEEKQKDKSDKEDKKKSDIKEENAEPIIQEPEEKNTNEEKKEEKSEKTDTEK